MGARQVGARGYGENPGVGPAARGSLQGNAKVQERVCDMKEELECAESLAVTTTNATHRVAELEAQIQENKRASQLEGQQHRHTVKMLKQQHEYAAEVLKKKIRKLELELVHQQQSTG